MLFPSEVFLFVFLPVVLVVYYALLRKTRTLKNIFLLAASLFFYAWGEPVYVYLMMGSILFNWLMGLFIDRARGKKWICVLMFVVLVGVNIGVLGWYKYSEFTVLPLNYLD